MVQKVQWKPGTMIYPLPVVLVSCGAVREEFNIITVAWTGTLCTEPVLCYISLRPERHSYGIIERNREYVINLTTEPLVRATDWCGVRSGRNFDKFKETGLTPGKAGVVRAPLIEESPVNIECVVKEIIPLGSHHAFLSEVVAVNADSRYLNPKTGAFELSRTSPLCYVHGRYYSLGRKLGNFGFSVRKKKPKKKNPRFNRSKKP
ncbi:MAG: flavin reductase family protein [Desulfobacteraceae bacterium]|nr:MAG: flavin reductase family protein [Desulfobacteraceae bacterium]